MAKILITGGAGFVASHCAVQALQAGHDVRVTLRSLSRAQEVRDMIAEGGADPSGIEVAIADLSADAGWDEAVADCDYLLHVASPFPPLQPQNDDEIIAPARDGALRALAAARDAGVKRAVLTSSYAAIGYGLPPRTKPFTELDWTDANAPGLIAYVRSKTIAERAAWDFIRQEGGGLELSVINPVAVFGPLLGPDASTSILMIKSVVEGGAANFGTATFGVVDVRDVADLHLRAMLAPNAAGERFLAIAGEFVSPAEIAQLFNERLGTRLEIPNVEIPTRAKASNTRAKAMLGWAPRSNEEALIATAESLKRFGLVKFA